MVILITIRDHFKKAENTSKGFVSWYLQRDVDNHMMLTFSAVREF